MCASFFLSALNCNSRTDWTDVRLESEENLASTEANCDTTINSIRGQLFSRESFSDSKINPDSEEIFTLESFIKDVKNLKVKNSLWQDPGTDT